MFAHAMHTASKLETTIGLIVALAAVTCLRTVATAPAPYLYLGAAGLVAICIPLPIWAASIARRSQRQGADQRKSASLRVTVFLAALATGAVIETFGRLSSATRRSEHDHTMLWVNTVLFWISSILLYQVIA